MCLDTKDSGTLYVTIGWKIFYRYGNYINGSHYNFTYMFNKWIKDNKYFKILASDGNLYTTGFHFFIQKNDAHTIAERWKNEINKNKLKVLMIKVKNITATGTQMGLKVGVARKIFIED